MRKHLQLPSLAAAGLVLAAAVVSAQTAQTPPAEHAHAGHDAAFYYPDNDEGIAALPARKAAQLATASQFSVFHGFQFADKLPESGITFRNVAVDDSGRE